MSSSPSAPAQAPITVIELVQASVAASEDNGSAFFRIFNLLDNLMEEVGKDAFVTFAKDVSCIARIAPPDSSSSSTRLGNFGPPLPPTPPFKIPQFEQWSDAARQKLLLAGFRYEREKYAAQCKDSVPNYEPHPAYLRFVEMAKGMLPLPSSPETIFEDFCIPETDIMPHPWHDDEEADEYKGFFATLEELNEQYHEQHHEQHYEEHYEQLPSPPPAPPHWSESITFTAQELLDAGIAWEAEMQAHNCTLALPNYWPLPAFWHFAQTWHILIEAHIFPLEYIHEHLGRQGMLQWLALDSVYRLVDSGRGMFRAAYEVPRLTLLNGNGDGDVDGMDLVDASNLVAQFEHPAIATIPAGTFCQICHLTFDEGVSNSCQLPIKTPCCRQVFGEACYVEYLQHDERCPTCLRIGNVPAPAVTQQAAPAEINLTANIYAPAETDLLDEIELC